MNEPVKGILAIIAAAIIWGLAPLYYKLLEHIPPFELLSHRTFWSFVFFFVVLHFSRRLGELRAAMFDQSEALFILLAAFLVATNWFFFIFSIQTNQAIEASLGYFILPLVSIVFGMLVFKETLSSGQWLSVALAASAVFILTYGLGQAPWIALILSISFSLYAVLKKRLKARPMVSVTLEVLILTPISLGIIAYFHFTVGGHFGKSFGTSLLLSFSGPLTATPLILFSYAAHRATLSTVGVLQYINPSLQFLCAALVFEEPLTTWHAVAFPMIWLALIFYSGASFYRSRSDR